MFFELNQYITEVFNEYHKPGYMALDPLEFVHGLKGLGNREVGGLLCSALAYGRVEQIRKSIASVFDITGKNVLRYSVEVPYKDKKHDFSTFKHRFNSGLDIALLLDCAGTMICRFGSLERLFTQGHRRDHGSIKPALEAFCTEMISLANKKEKGDIATFGFLFPLPSCGSACKRLNMFLRWMVRKSDGIDLGLWKSVSPEALIMPVDTHIAKIARHYKMTKRKTADWAMAEEITGELKSIDVHDPVRFDFSLCRAGMVDFRDIQRTA